MDTEREREVNRKTLPHRPEVIVTIHRATRMKDEEIAQTIGGGRLPVLEHLRPATRSDQRDLIKTFMLVCFIFFKITSPLSL